MELFETGIKVIDLLAPFLKGGKIGLFGGAGVGKTVLLMELITQHSQGVRRLFGFRRSGGKNQGRKRPLLGDEGIGSSCKHRTHIRTDERAAWSESQGRAYGAYARGVFPRHSGSGTYFFSSTTSSVSPRRVLRCRLFSEETPSAVGYQPTLSTDLGELQERITSTVKGSITSVQAIYVPADDLTDPAPATTFAHLDGTIVLSRQLTELGIYPAVDPLDSTSNILDPKIVGDHHYKIARDVQEVLQRYKQLQEIIAILGMDELSEEDKPHSLSCQKGPEISLAAFPRGRAVYGHSGEIRAHQTDHRGFRRDYLGQHGRYPRAGFLHGGQS